MIKFLIKKILSFFIDEYTLKKIIKKETEKYLEKKSYCSEVDDYKNFLNTDNNFPKQIIKKIKRQGNSILLNFDFEKIFKFKKIILDIYPTSRPQHPDRHFGHMDWDKVETKDITLEIDVRNKVFILNNKKPNNINLFGFNEKTEYSLNVILVDEEDSEKLISLNEFIFGVLETNDQKRIKETFKNKKLKSAVWFMTWKCNMKCTYCWEVQRIASGDLIPEKLTSYLDWLEPWKKLNPEILDISGGEPFLQKDFVPFINGLNNSTKISITTNLTHDLTDFVQNVNPDKINSITCSLHPSQKLLPFDLYVGRILLLKNRGFDLTVNFVTWPEQLWLIPKYKKYFENEIGVRFHVDPYAATPTHPFKWSNSELDFIKKYVGSDRSHWFKNEDENDVLCSGGVEHISVQPNGDIYRCIEDKHRNIKPIANLKDKNLTLNPTLTFCDVHFKCPGCDKDKIKAFPIKKTKTQREFVGKDSTITM